MISAAEILNASILVVDDQKVNVSLLERTLRDAGYTSIASTTDWWSSARRCSTR